MKRLLAVFLALVMTLSLVGCSEKQSAADSMWDKMILGEWLPEPPSEVGEIHDNSSECLWVEIENVSMTQYAEYVESCKEKGFTIDVEESGDSFEAYNSEGYYVSLDYYDNDEELDIELEIPMELGTISWPQGDAGKQIPAPKSTIGKFSYEYSDSFFVYVGETSKEDYDSYVASCADAGFVVDYNKGDDYYYAENEEGWSLSLGYKGNCIMTVSIDSPDETMDEDEVVTESTTAFATQAAETATTTQKQSVNNSGLDPDFKEAMDQGLSEAKASVI